MPRLGSYLKQLREQQDRSRRWVERQSRQLHPKEKDRQISHSYLRQIEEGMRDSPNPLKLQTLSEVYGVDYREILAAAGYLDQDTAPKELPPVQVMAPFDPKLEPTRQLSAWLESKGIHAVYFINGLMTLSDESLHLVNRLITTLSLQEKARPEQLRERSGSRTDA